MSESAAPADSGASSSAKTSAASKRSADENKSTAAKKRKVEANPASSDASPVLVVFGLGNIGEQHASQRHNIGERVISALLKTCEVEDLAVDGVQKAWKMNGSSRLQLLVPPLSAINDSGVALRKFLTSLGHEVPTASAILVVSDDCFLPLGTIRFKQKGSSGGHNALKNIESIYGDMYHKLKVGIGCDPSGKPSKDHVVGTFGDEELELVDAAVDRAVEAAKLWLRLGPESVQHVMGR